MEKEVINVPLALAKLYGFEDGLQLEASDFKKALGVVIDDAKGLVDDHRKDGKRLKSNPLLNLIDTGMFTVDRVLQEMPALVAKTSELPSGQRKVMMQAIEMAMAKMLHTASKELEDKMKGKSDKTE